MTPWLPTAACCSRSKSAPLPLEPETYLVGPPLVRVSDDGRVRHTPFEGNFDFSGSVPVAETAKKAASRTLILPCLAV